MVKALTIGLSVMAGILIGRIQITENHAANAAIESSDHAAARAASAKREVIRTRALLDKTERQVIRMWQRLEPLLEDFAYAESPIARDDARRRIQALRWEMDTIDATITAAREAGGADVDRNRFRQAYVNASFDR